jgi:hypothetical protein
VKKVTTDLPGHPSREVLNSCKRLFLRPGEHSLKEGRSGIKCFSTVTNARFSLFRERRAFSF